MINIGSTALQALNDLKDAPQLGRLVEAFGEIAVKRLIAACASPVDQRIAATSHAHGIWEVYEAFASAYENKLPSQLTPPAINPTVGRKGSNVRAENAYG